MIVFMTGFYIWVWTESRLQENPDDLITFQTSDKRYIQRDKNGRWYLYLSLGIGAGTVAELLCRLNHNEAVQVIHCHT